MENLDRYKHEFYKKNRHDSCQVVIETEDAAMVLINYGDQIMFVYDMSEDTFGTTENLCYVPEKARTQIQNVMMHGDENIGCQEQLEDQR